MSNKLKRVFFGAMIAFSVIVYTKPTVALSAPIQLIFPLDCKLNEDCFLQQMADLDLSRNVSDPFCGSASYDGHKGTDIRILSLKEMSKEISVLAAAGGVVKAIRDGEEDHLIESKADRDAVKNKECGNGLVIDHGDGIETQYCHLKKGSISVRKGQKVLSGKPIGSIGVSGMAQFPHLHLTLRQDGHVIDPFAGNALGQACGEDVSQSWWADKSFATQTADAVILKMSLSGAPINHNSLVKNGGPVFATKYDAVTVGWVWLANLRKGDRIAMGLLGPGGLKVVNKTKSLESNKASWSGFVGKKKRPAPGIYYFRVQILRDGEILKTRKEKFIIK